MKERRVMAKKSVTFPGTDDEKFINNTDLSLSVYRDNSSGILYVNIANKNKPGKGIMITAEAAFHVAETVDKVFDLKANAHCNNTLN